MSGMVYLVGAGPGDPDLMTVRGMRCLRRAEVVVYDRLVSPELLAEAPENAELVYAGKAPGNHSCRQEEIHDLLIHHALEGKVVVRLKGGDPFLFGRGAEEVFACAEAGIPCEVVPGVTSATSVPALGGHPGDPSRSGHELRGGDRALRRPRPGRLGGPRPGRHPGHPDGALAPGRDRGAAPAVRTAALHPGRGGLPGHPAGGAGRGRSPGRDRGAGGGSPVARAGRGRRGGQLQGKSDVRWSGWYGVLSGFTYVRSRPVCVSVTRRSIRTLVRPLAKSQ